MLERTPAVTRVLTVLVSLAIALPATSVVAQPQLSDAEFEALIADIEAEAAEASTLLEDLRSDRLQPAVVIEATGTDPVAILGWVRDETEWVPYGGALRGAQGVLMDRVGNGLDRALLLAELLAIAGHDDVRLARATLDGDAAAALVASAVVDETMGLPELSGDLADLPHDVVEQAERLMTAVGEREADTDPAAALALAADHWWVQVDVGEDVPLDLDPVLGAGARPGLAAEETHLPAELPDELRQALAIRLVTERLDDAGLAEEVTLDHRLLLGDGRPYATLELAFDYATGGRIDLPTDDPTLEELVVMPFWRPMLRVDGDRVEGTWFSIDGTLGIPAEPPAAGSALGEGSSLVDALGGDEEPEAEAPSSQLTAAWIEYETLIPGAEPEVHRRELFDLLGGDRRAAASDPLGQLGSVDPASRGQALLGSAVMLLQAAGIDPLAINEAYLRDTIDSRSGRIALAFISSGRQDERILPSLEATTPYPLDLLTMAAARGWLSPDPGATYIAEPNLWSTHVRFRHDGGRLRAWTATDIVLNDVAVRPDPGVDPFGVRVRAGLLDTLLEHELRGPDAPDNTWSLFRDGDIGAWHALTSAADLDELAMAVPPADRIRMADRLERGDIILLSPAVRDRAGEEHVDWWRVRPDGTTLGIGFQGWGAQVGENVITRDMVTEEMIRRRVQQQAIAICERFGLAADALNTTLIAKELLAARGMPLLPQRRAAACTIRL